LRVTATSDPAIDLEDAKRKAGLLERAFHAELSFTSARP
jgi:hypothetical protein